MVRDMLALHLGLSSDTRCRTTVSELVYGCRVCLALYSLWIMRTQIVLIEMLQTTTCFEGARELWHVPGIDCGGSTQHRALADVKRTYPADTDNNADLQLD